MNSIKKENRIYAFIPQEKTANFYQCRFNRDSLAGFTLLETIISISISLIVIIATGVLLYTGNRIWFNTYNSVHKPFKQEALSTMIAFGQVGRKSNRLNYKVYNVSGETFTPAAPVSLIDTEVVSGDAVEFRYWDVPLDSTRIKPLQLMPFFI
jgi:Tfp pilus assembly protein PilV